MHKCVCCVYQSAAVSVYPTEAFVVLCLVVCVKILLKVGNSCLGAGGRDIFRGSNLCVAPSKSSAFVPVLHAAAAVSHLITRLDSWGQVHYSPVCLWHNYIRAHQSIFGRKLILHSSPSSTETERGHPRILNVVRFSRHWKWYQILM